MFKESEIAPVILVSSTAPQKIGTQEVKKMKIKLNGPTVRPWTLVLGKNFKSGFNLLQRYHPVDIQNKSPSLKNWEIT